MHTRRQSTAGPSTRMRRLWLVVPLMQFAALPQGSAQPKGRMSTVGFLASGTATATSTTVATFRNAMRELGWVEGRNLVPGRSG
jgi:hypothetical protein